jgi:hypothetical protein
LLRRKRSSAGSALAAEGSARCSMLMTRMAWLRLEDWFILQHGQQRHKPG